MCSVRLGIMDSWALLCSMIFWSCPGLSSSPFFRFGLIACSCYVWKLAVPSIRFLPIALLQVVTVVCVLRKVFELSLCLSDDAGFNLVLYCLLNMCVYSVL